MVGRAADLVGRKRVYWLVAAIMVVGALGSALAPSYWVLIFFRFVLRFGVGGDYPVSAVLMSEYANRKDRGTLVGMVFSTQALGLIVGPLIALALLGGGGNDIAWRIMLASARCRRGGGVPAPKMPESPRYQAQVQGRPSRPWPDLHDSRRARHAADPTRPRRPDLGLRAFLTNRRWLVMLRRHRRLLVLLDYAYYGNTISTPQIIALISPHSSTMTAIALQLAIFVVAAVPGYVLAIARLDRIGHRKLQLIGFAMMGLCFAVIGRCPGMTTTVAPFLLVYGLSYFFTEFGPNMTTFVLPSEVFPGDLRDRPRHLRGHRQARRVHRRVPVPGPAELPRAAWHAAADRGRLGTRGGAYPRPARARRPQPGGDRGQHPRPRPPSRCAWPTRHRPREDLTGAHRHVPGARSRASARACLLSTGPPEPRGVTYADRPARPPRRRHVVLACAAGLPSMSMLACAHGVRTIGPMAETRTCEQCGTVFTPRREHARFCRPRCRVAWNREHTGDPQAEASALEWSITAMREAIQRLSRDQVLDHGQGFAVISEAVWSVTIVDATLVRYHRHAYKSAMKSRAQARRQAIEGTFAGLRFVRNQMGYHLDPADFIQARFCSCLNQYFAINSASSADARE